MLKFKTDRLLLLKELRNLLSESVDDSKVNVDLDEEVALFLTEVTDKRRVRKLKSVRNELDKWINEIVEYRKKSNVPIATQS